MMQNFIKIVILIVIASVNSRPIMWLDAPEEYILQDFENYILSPNEMKKYNYFTTSEPSISRTEIIESTPTILADKTLRDLAETKLDNQTLRTIGKLMRQGLSLRNALQEVTKVTTLAPEATSIYIEEIFTTEPSTTEKPTTFSPNLKQNNILQSSNFSIIDERDKDNVTVNGRPLRQEMQSEQNENEDGEGGNNAENDEREPRQESSEEQSDEDEGGGGGGVGGLISAFLSSLSRPDGGVDVDAIAGLIGSLSTQNDDGSYNFSGLTELLMSFFGGDEEEGGGGSDIGRFLGGLIGAFIKGVAQPPGAKGAGILTGKILGGILPALSGPAATETPTDQPPTKDAGGFVTGLLGTLSAGSGTGNGSNGAGSKFSFIKTIIGIFTSILTSASSSSSSSNKSW